MEILCVGGSNDGRRIDDGSPITFRPRPYIRLPAINASSLDPRPPKGEAVPIDIEEYRLEVLMDKQHRPFYVYQHGDGNLIDLLIAGYKSK